MLRLDFTGTLNDQLRGFYRSSYTDRDGVERHLATTQFEATDARRAFPCWDEPAVKATFEVTLVVPEELEAISNMPVAGTESASGGRRGICLVADADERAPGDRRARRPGLPSPGRGLRSQRRSPKKPAQG